METKILSEEQIKKLKEPLPKEAISQHPTKSYLSSIKAIYVVERLNDVFGIGSWTQDSKVISCENGNVVVYSTLEIPTYGIRKTSFGGNDNGGESNKNFDLGDAYKGACTDALTKMCSFLGIGMEVFKGLVNPTGGQPKDNATEKPYLNKFTGKNSGVLTKEWNAVIVRLQEKTATIAQIKEHYRLSKENQTELEKYI